MSRSISKLRRCLVEVIAPRLDLILCEDCSIKKKKTFIIYFKLPNQNDMRNQKNYRILSFQKPVNFYQNLKMYKYWEIKQSEFYPSENLLRSTFTSSQMTLHICISWLALACPSDTEREARDNTHTIPNTSIAASARRLRRNCSSDEVRNSI